MKKLCNECGLEMKYTGESSTYVAYLFPKGHDHDDNLVIRYYRCANGHKKNIVKVNKCTFPGCKWVSKLT